MAEAFKNVFNKTSITSMANHLATTWPEFNSTAFIKTSLKAIDALEFKQRSAQITDALTEYLPTDFAQTSQIILNSLTPVESNPTESQELSIDDGICSWCIMPLTYYVTLHGLKHFDHSMELLKQLTKRFSSEFDIRTFLIAEPDKTLAVLEQWSTDKNFHVRRLVSEGSRPRLPWAMKLQQFIDDPSAVINLLEKLKDDDIEYVRRSVANSLNDIAKDHPDLVAEIAKRWLVGADNNRKRLVRHACRTLIKQGHKNTLASLGYHSPEIKAIVLNVETADVIFGSKLEFNLSITSDSTNKQPLIIDYIIHHQKANGSTSPKVFKWKNLTLSAKSTMNASRAHAMRKISTRVYYSGLHRLEIMVNGESVAIEDFYFRMKS